MKDSDLICVTSKQKKPDLTDFSVNTAYSNHLWIFFNVVKIT